LLILAQLNDVISLLVGLWAVKVANEKTNSKKYTYGVSSNVVLGAETLLTTCSGNAQRPLVLS